MNSSFVLYFFERKNTGKKINIKLRTENKIPSVIYKNKFSASVFFDKVQVLNLINIFFSGKKLVMANLNGESFFVIIKSFLKHPFKNEILHFDFQKVEDNDYVTADIPFNFVGEKDSIGIKQGGYLVKYMNFVKVKSLVKNIPDYIDVDVSNLNVNRSIFLNELKINSNFKFIQLFKKNSSNLLIASIVGSRVDTSKEKESIKK